MVAPLIDCPQERLVAEWLMREVAAVPGAEDLPWEELEERLKALAACCDGLFPGGAVPYSLLMLLAARCIHECGCASDSDCVKRVPGCCGCSSGGREVAVAKKCLHTLEDCKQDPRRLRCPMSYHCTPREARCVDGECVLE